MCTAFLGPRHPRRIGNGCPTWRAGYLGWDHWRDGSGPARARRHARRTDRRRRGRRRRPRIRRTPQRRRRNRQDQRGPRLRARGGRPGAGAAVGVRRPDGAAGARPAARRRAGVRWTAGGGVRRRRIGGRRLHRGPRRARGHGADGARRRGRPLGRRRDARRARLRRAADRVDPRGARPDLPRRRDRPVAPAAAPAGRPRRAPGAPAGAAAVVAHGGAASRRDHRRRRRRRAPRRPAATRSSSPRCWPPAPTSCPPRSSRRCSPGCSAWARPAARRSSSSRSCRPGSRSSSPASCSATASTRSQRPSCAGMLEVSTSHLGFRHELARRAIERSLPALARRRLNARVLDALQQRERPERASLMHFAVEAGDVDTVLAVGPAAAREAARAGSHRQALAHLESVRPHLDRLGERERAAVLDELRLGALQRPSLPRGGRRRAGGGRAVRAAGRPGRRRPLPRARVAPPVHGG